MPYSVAGDVTVKNLECLKDIGCDDITKQINLQNSNLTTAQALNNSISKFKFNFQALNSLVVQTQCQR